MRSGSDDNLADLHDQAASRGLLRGHERLYDAYNELHVLAQSFNKPFDAPAILVVGHQTDGKSALVEALMGFQFNSVGGGTKTRRPIAIHMKYNAACAVPACFLRLDDGVTDRVLSLTELQAYIDADNAALERESRFAAQELVVRMEYRHCPNLTIIDTPGLISPAPGRKNCALQACAAQVEEIVRAKAQVPEYVILCLEDCSDWSNATTRRLVMQVDPNLARTVLVSTKFDTRLPQFARAADCEMFLRPSALDGCTMLGDAPFFTSVPSGRVGEGSDCVFPTHDAFRDRLAEREAADVEQLEAKLNRKLGRAEREHVGVGALRRFLEQLLQRRYLEAVPSILPLLEGEQRATQQRLDAVRRDLSGLNPEQLKDKGRAFVDSFLAHLQQLLRGTISAAPDTWGETLSEERARGGAFVLGGHARPLAAPEAVPNAAMRLYGGAQFHRAMSEFRLLVGALPCPEVSAEEILNACGLDYEGGHDGANYVRTACVIAVSKAKAMLEPYIHQLGSRLAHVLRRLLHMSLALMQQGDAGGVGAGGGASAFMAGAASPAALTDQFVRRVTSAFHAFLADVENSCKERCLEDLASVTRYVSWSLHTRNAKGLRQLLGKVRVTGGEGSPSYSHPAGAAAPGGAAAKGSAAAAGISREPSMTGGAAAAAGSLSLPEMLEATLWSRNLTGVSEDIVRALVSHQFEGIRDHLVQAAELKFNCFFLMPLVDSFPARLRRDIERAYEEGLDEVFDSISVRLALEGREGELQEELARVDRLQRKFYGIHSTLVHGPSLASGPVSRAITDLDASVMLASVAVTPVPYRNAAAAAAADGGGGGVLQTPKAARGEMAAYLANAGAAAAQQQQPGAESRPLGGGRAGVMGASPGGVKAGLPGVQPSLAASAARRATPSAAGAAAVAAGASGSHSLVVQQARALVQQHAHGGGLPLAAPGGGLERDNGGERDVKDKALASLSMGDKAALTAPQQHAGGAAVPSK